jgi:hypothetical protein
MLFAKKQTTPTWIWVLTEGYQFVKKNTVAPDVRLDCICADFGERVDREDFGRCPFDRELVALNRNKQFHLMLPIRHSEYHLLSSCDNSNLSLGLSI